VTGKKKKKERPVGRDRATRPFPETCTGQHYQQTRTVRKRLSRLSSRHTKILGRGTKEGGASGTNWEVYRKETSRDPAAEGGESG